MKSPPPPTIPLYPPPPFIFIYIRHSPTLSNADSHAPPPTMNGHQPLHSSCTLKTRSNKSKAAAISLRASGDGGRIPAEMKEMKQKKKTANGFWSKASFMNWSMDDAVGLFRFHPMPCVFAVSLLFFMGVEYTLRMVPSSSPPFDLGFVATEWLHRILASSPDLNTLLAGLNTVRPGASFHAI